ncbi:transcription termination factor Rho, partial [Anaplasma marginale]
MVVLVGFSEENFMSEGVMEKEESIVKGGVTETPSEGGRVLNLCELKQKSTEELLVTAEELGVVSNGRMLKQEI